MQPPRPFPGASYDKSMFTFLPTPSNSDVLTESSRKRKLISSDHQISLPPSSVRNGFRMPDPKCNTSGWRGKAPQTFVPSFPPMESFHSGDFSHESRNWGQNGHLASGDFHLASSENPFQSQEFRNSGLKKPNVLPAGSHEHASKNLQQSTGTLFGDADGKCPPEKTYSTDSSSSAKQGGDASTFAGCDSAILIGDNVFNLQQTNELLQNAIRLLSASGVDIAASLGGKDIADTGKDKSVEPPSDSVSQNITCPQIMASIPKNEACPSLDKSGHNGEKDYVKLDQEHKSENGAPTPAEKLWDGTLQLSSAVTVPAIAFFKSGEKMVDFTWSGKMEIKGKVRLEAFEKYVQNLPRSRTRGLMVTSLRLKEGSSNSCYKGLKQVVQKYKDGKKVGFAQLPSGVDLYVCPNSDTIVTILAKYGFFKGMTAALDKSDQLLGCVVWRKNTPLATTTKTTKVNDPPSAPSLSSPSKPVPSPVAEEKSTVSITSQGSSSKDQKLTENGEKSGDRSPKIAQNSDDDDLPEYDFRSATSQTSPNKPLGQRTVEPKLGAEQFRNCHVSLPLPPQMRTERSTDPIAPPGFHFQGQIPQNVRHQLESHALKLPTDPRKPISDQITRQNVTNFQGVAPKPIGNMPNPKPRNIYDDDDMPEWCPPVISNPSHPKSFDNGYHFSPRDPRSFSNKSTVMGFADERVVGPQGVGLNPGLRPRFEPPSRNNPIHPTSWKSLGP